MVSLLITLLTTSDVPDVVRGLDKAGLYLFGGVNIRIEFTPDPPALLKLGLEFCILQLEHDDGFDEDILFK